MTQVGLSGVAYCGTDLGVYYRDPSVSTSWQSYSTGLPVVPVRDLEIHYASGTIRAGTFGRSVWVSPLNQVVVPVELLAFQGQLVVGTKDVTEGVLLTWQTASEVHFNRFEIERSVDTKTWTKFDEQRGKGAGSYETLDKKPVYGINYYRLKMLDDDGSVSYSKTVAVDWVKPSSKTWALFPNPVKDKLFLSGNEDVAGEQAVQILDVSGKVMVQTTVANVRNGLAVKDLPNGAYFLEFKDKQVSERKSFVVER